MIQVQQGTLSYLLGGNLYPAGIYVPSGIFAADDPTRRRPVRAPTLEPPRWLQELHEGRVADFDRVVAADAMDSLGSRWLRLLLGLQALPGQGDQPYP